jgi:hypothetical protein
MNNKERMLQICADIKILNHSVDMNQVYDVIYKYKDEIKNFEDFENDKLRIVWHYHSKVLDKLTKELVKLVELEFNNN